MSGVMAEILRDHTDWGEDLILRTSIRLKTFHE